MLKVEIKFHKLTCRLILNLLFVPTHRTKKDYSEAIMDRKKAPHKLQAEDSKQDDNSVVEMTQAKMDELKIFKGDAVILKGMLLFKLAVLRIS